MYVKDAKRRNKMLKNYLVTWTIEVFDAESVEDAAEMAFNSIREEDTIATVFEVYEEIEDGYSKVGIEVDVG